MILADKIGKRYQKEWIFRDFSAQFAAGARIAITGQNGSGKSTLMQVLSGYLSPSKGKINFRNTAGTALDKDRVYEQVSFCAPYIELIEEFTLLEAVQFHQRFQPFAQGLSAQQLVDILQLPAKNNQKPLRYFSSGMRQRVKLALAICTQSPILLLDEPTITLDANGCTWFQSLLQTYVSPDRLLVIASNVPDDYQSCQQVLSIMDYK